MKKNNSHKTLWIGVGVLILIFVGLTMPFLIIHGRYSFHNFWRLFFTKIFNWEAFVHAFGPIVSKIPVSLELTIISGFFGLTLGLLLALVRVNKIPILNPIRAVFVSFIRGTPILVQLYLTYTGIPLVLQAINLNYGTNYNINVIPTSVLAIIAFSLNEAAYNSETIRAAIQSVDKGQIEAAKSIGMTGFQVFKRVTLPEAARVATAPLGNSLIGLLKGTSLAFVVSVVEMTAQAQITAGSSFRTFETYFALALVYWPLCFVLENLIRFVESKLDVQMQTPKHRMVSFMKNSLTHPFNSNVNSDKGHV